MAMLAYFDESGTTQDAKVLVVSGYIAPVSEWNRYQDEWRRVLSDAGIDPSRTPFHMSEFEARNQPWMVGGTPFSGWPDAKADKVLRDLIGIIRSRAKVGIGTAVVVDDHEQVKAETNDPGSRYGFCVVRCLNQCAAWAHQNGIEDDIVYVFEDGAGYNQEVNKAVAQIMADREWRREYRMASLAFGDKRRCLQLQAADIGVWEAPRYCLSSRPHDNAGMRASPKRCCPACVI